MKRPHPVLASLVLLFTGCAGKTVDVVLPENFSGQATIFFDVPDAAKLADDADTVRDDADTVRIEFPSNGLIYTRSNPPAGTFRFWFRSKSGVASRVEMIWWQTIEDEPSSRRDPTIGVSGPSTGSGSTLIDGRHCETTMYRFLVGTQAQLLDFREPERPAHYALGCTNSRTRARG